MLIDNQSMISAINSANGLRCLCVRVAEYTAVNLVYGLYGHDTTDKRHPLLAFKKIYFKILCVQIMLP